MVKAEHWVALSIVGGMVALAVWATTAIWSECRAEGHSFLYCLNMVSGR